jgi:parallel beta-helix repeat protein
MSNNSWTRINGCRIAQFDTGVYSTGANLTVQDSSISAMNTGINLYYAKDATIRNSIITGGSYCGIYADRSSGTIANNTVSGGSWAAIRLYTNVAYEYGPYTVYNNTLKPAGGSGTLMTIHGDINASIYWNNFTATSGYYIDESPATAKLNTTINGKPEGNIYANVISGSVAVQGNVSSSGFPQLYIGFNGTGYPYSAATSQGKIVGNAVDYAPLTPFLYLGDSMPPLPNNTTLEEIPPLPEEEGAAAEPKAGPGIEMPKPKQAPVEPVVEDEEPASKVAPKTATNENPARKVTPKGEPVPKATPTPKVAQKVMPKKGPAQKIAPKAEPAPKVTPKVEPKPKSEPAVSQKAAPRQEASASNAASAAKSEPASKPAVGQKAGASATAEPAAKAAMAAKGEASATAKREPAPSAATEAPVEAGAIASD